MFNLISIPTLQDNYVWLLHNTHNECLIIDPGVDKPVLDYLYHHQLTPKAILLTHHHRDHTDGVTGIIKQYPTIPVYGPSETKHQGCTHPIGDKNKIHTIGLTIQVIAIPGHTLEHVAYYSAPYLFCGDTLFSAGCGRVFEGTTQQMYHSLQLLAALPNDTLICCAHEYTETNLKFAHHILPENKQINHYLQHIQKIRHKQQPSIPSTLELEKKINLFLGNYDTELNKLFFKTISIQQPWQVFKHLRQLKDNF